MQFDSLAAILDMGGYGAFVWSVYLLGLLILAGNVILPLLATRRFFGSQARQRHLMDEQERENESREQAGGDKPGQLGSVRQVNS